MRINQINLYNYNQNKQVHKRTISPIGQDSFICSNKISFKGNSFETSFLALKNELTAYVFSNHLYSEKEIEKILKRYCPKTTFKKAQRIQANNSDIVSYSGNTEKEYSIKKDIFGRKKATLKKQEVSVVFPNSTTRKEKLLFISRLIHESTHALQAEDLEKITELNIINNFLRNENDSKIISANIEGAFCSYESLSMQLIEAIDEAAQECCLFDNIANTDKICLEYFGVPTQKIALDLIQEIFDDFNYKMNKNFVLRFCIQMAKLEIEAYTKEMEFLESTKLINEANQAKMKIEVNQAIIDAAKLLL